MGNGVHYTHTGNVDDRDGQSTSCPGCGNRVIERTWCRIGGYRLDDIGHCRSCGLRVSGRFEGPPGDWGTTRLPIRITN